METITFYRDWLGLDNTYFRLLAILAATGEFHGNLSALCRLLDLSAQNKNRQKLATAIDVLAANGYTEAVKEGITYTLCPIPRGKEIALPAEWVRRIMAHEYKEEISPQAVLKILLWYADNKREITQNKEVACDCAMSTDTVSLAKRVLEEHFHFIVRETITTRQENGSFKTLGQIVNVVRWFEDEEQK